MKRTYQQALTFFKRNTKNRGEGRELYFTPENIIREIVDSLLKNKPELKNYIWIDPCAGDGRWSKIINEFGIKCQNYDIKPLSEDVKTQDFFSADFQNNVFFIGNPPFSLVEKFVNKALSMTNFCYFLGGSSLLTGKISNKVDLLHRFEGFEGNQKDKRSKLIFKDTFNKDITIWCCGALFSNKKSYNLFEKCKVMTENTFKVRIKNFVKIDDRIIAIKKTKSFIFINGIKTYLV